MRIDGSPYMKNEIFDCMLKSELSSSEVSLLLWLIQRQDQNGNIFGVHYRTVCDGIKISIQTFYTALKGLSDKGFINYVKNHYTDYDVTVKNNTFRNNNERRGYFNITAALFSMEKFHALKAPEKLLLIYIYRFYKTNNATYQIDKRKFLRKWMGTFKVSRRILLSYIRTLKVQRFISFGERDGKYFFTPLKYVTETDEREEKIDRKRFHRNFVIALCRRYKYRFDNESVKDVMHLIDQYVNIANVYKKNVLECLNNVLKKVHKIALQLKNETFLKAKLIHFHLKMEIMYGGVENVTE